MLEPYLHLPIPMGSRVSLDPSFTSALGPFKGEVIGVASMHMTWTYIVLLDTPYQDPELGVVRAVAVPGPQLRSEDGSSTWRLSTPLYQKLVHSV